MSTDEEPVNLWGGVRLHDKMKIKVLSVINFVQKDYLQMQCQQKTLESIATFVIVFKKAFETNDYLFAIDS